MKEKGNDPHFAKEMYQKLRQVGCEETDELLVKYSSLWEQYASQENARRMQEFKENNPAMMAKDYYDKGDYDMAVNKYREAIGQEADPQKQASYHFSIASTLFRKLKKYSEARSEARKALSLKPGWGRPLALIGDMYSVSARNCGDSWNQSLAIIASLDKWKAAKSLELDPEELSVVNNKINKYRGYLPMKDDGFMRGVAPGASQKVGCWIGETVRVQYR